MKKLSMLFVAFSVALVANAQAVKWKVNATSEYLDYGVFLVASIDSNWSSANDIQAAAVKFGGENGYGKILSYQGGSSFAKKAALAVGSDITPQSMKNAYVVLVGPGKNTYNYLQVDFSESVYDHTAPVPEGPTASVATAKIMSEGTQGTFGGTDPTPEPTSGLLLLLGAAGLALRRRVK